ncbi:MAG TPA: helix-turn-helix transcriptional regulator [Alphaproteobacteria bacterium]|nr:helix-turn-helix transcriptional regulator [Alphaproteobacteria bacterium]
MRLIRRFPDPHELRGGSAFLRAFAAGDLVIHATAERARYAPHEAHATLKTVFSGAEHYAFDRRRVGVRPGDVLLLNRGRPHASAVAERTESLALFFAPARLAAAAAAFAADEAALLDGVEAAPAAFMETVQPADPALAGRLAALRRAIRAGEAEGLALEEAVHGVLAALLRQDRGLRRAAEALPAARPATRAELLRRLLRARDLMASDYARDLDLAEIAAAACLSPHHFLRSFARAFGRTPAQFLAERRLDVARRRIAATGEPIGLIAASVGYGDPAAFARAFRRRHGMSPSALRRAD